MGLMQSNKMQWGQERHQPFMGDPMAGAWQISRSFPGTEGEGNQEAWEGRNSARGLMGWMNVQCHMLEMV